MTVSGVKTSVWVVTAAVLMVSVVVDWMYVEQKALALEL